MYQRVINNQEYTYQKVIISASTTFKQATQINYLLGGVALEGIDFKKLPPLFFDANTLTKIIELETNE